MIRTKITSIDAAPVYLRTTVAAALICSLNVSLWQVRDLIVVHVDDGGPDGWRIFMPVERDSDALEVFTRLSQRIPASIGMHIAQVSCSFGAMYAVARAFEYHNDMGAALRGAITNAALKLYKHETLA